MHFRSIFSIVRGVTCQVSGGTHPDGAAGSRNLTGLRLIPQIIEMIPSEAAEAALQLEPTRLCLPGGSVPPHQPIRQPAGEARAQRLRAGQMHGQVVAVGRQDRLIADQVQRQRLRGLLHAVRPRSDAPDRA